MRRKLNINNIKLRLKSQDKVTILEYKLLLEKIFYDLQDPDSYNSALELLCLVCEDLPNDELIIRLTSDCISESRVFLYSDMLTKRGIVTPDESVLELSRRAFYTLPTATTLAKPQREVYITYRNHRRLVVSAPTSFGKTRLFFEIIADNSYKKVGIVMPTNALLHETFFTIRSNTSLSRYKVINSTRISPHKVDFEIYLFTPEKMDIYLDENPDLKFDFFLFDEIYKIDNCDDRELVFTNVLYRLLSMNCDFYLIGPYFNEFSKSVLSKYRAIFKKIDTDIVQKETYNYISGPVIINNKELEFATGKNVRLKRILNSLKSQSLIYTSNKRQAESVAKYISKNVKPTFTEPSLKLSQLMDYISNNISDGWSLLECLQTGCAFHHAGVPKYIGNEIIDLFNTQQISTIVCTSTLTEGINTSAKNVILYDNKKADGIPITGFEAKNIAGRAGRFGEHFFGRVINLEEPVSESDIERIEFSLFDNEFLSNEQNILLNEADLTPKQAKSRSTFVKLIQDKNIPISLFKSIKYILLDNIIRLIVHLRENRTVVDRFYFSSEIPNKETFSNIFSVVYEYLFTNRDKNDQKWSHSKLLYFTKFYLYKQPTIKELILADDYSENVDTKVRHVLDLIYHYFEFSLPKYFSAFEKIFNFVFPESPINMQYVTKVIQYGGSSNEEIILYEAGIPRDLAIKVSRYVPQCEDIFDVINNLRSSPRLLTELHPFEKTLIQKLIL